MYYISKRLEISAAHRLQLDYPSKCTNLHGHNWIVTVHCRAAELNANGMVTDFTHIKALITDRSTTPASTTCCRSTLPPKILPAGYATTWKIATALRCKKAKAT